MVRNPPYEPIPLGGFPHARGDGPQQYRPFFIPHTFSPRPWGWSVEWQCQGMGNKVFPTPVGMVRKRSMGLFSWCCFPHARGDGPCCHCLTFTVFMFSPRPWGWSEDKVVVFAHHRVFPTPVGMVRNTDSARSRVYSFPHARGDGPAVLYPGTPDEVFSPRPWGWSALHHSSCPPGGVFPTPVGMVRINIAMQIKI